MPAPVPPAARRDTALQRRYDSFLAQRIRLQALIDAAHLELHAFDAGLAQCRQRAEEHGGSLVLGQQAPAAAPARQQLAAREVAEALPPRAYGDVSALVLVWPEAAASPRIRCYDHGGEGWDDARGGVERTTAYAYWQPLPRHPRHG